MGSYFVLDKIREPFIQSNQFVLHSRNNLINLVKIIINFRKKKKDSYSKMASASHTDDIKAEIASNKVMVYSKSYCPFCVQTKNLLQEQGIAY